MCVVEDRSLAMHAASEADTSCPRYCTKNIVLYMPFIFAACIFCKSRRKSGNEQQVSGALLRIFSFPLLHIWIGEDSYNFRETKIAGNLRSAVIKPVLVATGKMEKGGWGPGLHRSSFFLFFFASPVKAREGQEEAEEEDPDKVYQDKG